MNARREQFRKEQEEQRAQADLRMMKTPEIWPRWPVLPIKRRRGGGQFPECAVLVADQGAKVYMCGLYQIEDTTLANAEIKEYHDFQAMIDDGWRID